MRLKVRIGSDSEASNQDFDDDLEQKEMEADLEAEILAKYNTNPSRPLGHSHKKSNLLRYLTTSVAEVDAKELAQRD